MASGSASSTGMAWVAFALMTVATWGLYGNFLHAGQTSMADPANGRYRAFLFVGIAYFLTAVLAPLVLLAVRGAGWQFSPRGMGWSLLAGTVGAIGAFCVLLAFGAGGSPSAVMAIIFAGAPVVNAVYALSLHPPAGGLGGIRWPFFLGIALAAIGGGLVTLYKPAARPPGARPGVQAPASPESAGSNNSHLSG